MTINQEVDVESQVSMGKDGDQEFELLVELKKEGVVDHEVRDEKLEFENKKVDVDQTIRVCPFCPKTFKSGKALGGHMRMHKDQLVHKKPKPSISKKSKELTTCMVCGRHFPSDKSLFGHMRCHPDRDWRGVCPPSTVGDSAVDLTESLFMGWAVTAKRGRKAVLKSEEEEDKLRGVCFLMMLSRGVLSNAK